MLGQMSYQGLVDKTKIWNTSSGECRESGMFFKFLFNGYHIIKFVDLSFVCSVVRAQIVTLAVDIGIRKKLIFHNIYFDTSVKQGE